MEKHGRPRTQRSMVRLETGGFWVTGFPHPSAEERPASSILARLAPLQTILAPSCAFLRSRPGCHRGPAHLLFSEQETSCDGNTLDLLVYEKGEQDPSFSKTIQMAVQLRSCLAFSAVLHSLFHLDQSQTIVISSRVPAFHIPGN